jgi:hypothetical protein
MDADAHLPASRGMKMLSGGCVCPHDQEKAPAPRDHRRRAKRTRRAAGVMATNEMMRHAERALAEQAEASYRRVVQNQCAGGPARKVGASATPERA